MPIDSRKRMTRKKSIDSDSKGKQFNLYMLTDNRIIYRIFFTETIISNLREDALLLSLSHKYF